MKNILKVLGLAAATLLASGAHAQSSTGNSSLQVTVGAEAALTVGSPTTLSSAGSNFANYTGTTSLTYFIRTSQASGHTGSIVLQVTGDFSPANGPSVGTPPTAGDALTYNCAVAQPGNGGTATPCTGPVTASTTLQTSVTSFGNDAHSAIGGNSASVSWTLTNDSKYKTGNYSATVTFTISAT
jgi:hypothetical protein